MGTQAKARTDAEWAAGFLAALKSHHVSVDAVPPGFKTTIELARAWRKSRPQAQQLLKAGIKAGIVEKRKFRVRCTKFVRLVEHYKWKQ